MTDATPKVEPAAPLVEHFFRHEAGRLVAVLTRFFGWRHFDLVEEMVQATLLAALQIWRLRGVPENPSGWIHQAARHRIIDALRRGEIGRRAARGWAASRSLGGDQLPDLFLDTEIADSQLQMMFACCHPLLSREDQLALTLKSLCGFSNPEIARGLLTTEDAIKKRLQRARQTLVREGVALEAPPAEQLETRLESVHQVLYLLFNEGYSASQGESAIRTELCEEAARLCQLLCEHRHCRQPATLALMALMLFHAARLESRLDSAGGVLLMEDQDRSRWDQGLLTQAKRFLDESATGTRVSPYHLEAGIALLHCAAPNYAATDWKAILQLYDILMARFPSPIYLLNRAIVIAHIEGAPAGIRSLLENPMLASLQHYHLVDATLGELYRRAGNFDQARAYFQLAKEKTRSPWDRAALERRLGQCREGAAQ